MQLDLFEHSRDVMLRNDVIDALKRRDAAASGRAMAALAAEYPDDRLLAPAAVLLERLSVPISGPMAAEAAAALLREMEGIVADAAKNLFGRDAQAWLAPLWENMAQAIERLPFDSRRENLHAAPLLLRAQCWPRAAASVETIVSWRRVPASLAWMIEARCRSAGLAQTWPLFAELAWAAPARARALLARMPQDDIGRRARRFDADFEGDGVAEDFAWFPAWALIDDPHLTEPMRLTRQGADTPPERALRLVLELLSLERQGRHADLIESRRRLRDTQQALFAFYMRSR